MGSSSPVSKEVHFRIRTDTGTVDASPTWVVGVNEDQACPLPVGSNFRVRVSVQNTGTAADTITTPIFSRCGYAGATFATLANVINGADASSSVDATAVTVQRLTSGAGAFETGAAGYDENESLSTAVTNGKFTEVEQALVLTGGASTIGVGGGETWIMSLQGLTTAADHPVTWLTYDTGGSDFNPVANLGVFGQRVADSASITLTTIAAASAGNLVVVTVGCDNNGTGDADYSEISGVTINGETATKAVEYTNGQGAAQGGATVSIWWKVLAGAAAQGSSIVASFTTPATNGDVNIIAARAFTVAAGKTVSVAATNQAATDGAAAPSLDATTTNIECLRVRATAFEGNSAGAAGASGQAILATNNKWSLWWSPGNFCGTEQTVLALATESTISTGTGDASQFVTGLTTSDNASAYVAFKATTSATQLTATSLVGGAAVIGTPALTETVRPWTRDSTAAVTVTDTYDVTEDGTTTYHYISDGWARPQGTYRLTFDYKGIGPTPRSLQWYWANTATWADSAGFGINTDGTLTGVNENGSGIHLVSRSVTAIADGFYRVEAVITISATFSSQAINFLLNAGQSYTGLNDGSGASIHNVTLARVTGFAVTGLTGGAAVIGTPAIGPAQWKTASADRVTVADTYDITEDGSTGTHTLLDNTGREKGTYRVSFDYKGIGPTPRAMLLWNVDTTTFDVGGVYVFTDGSVSVAGSAGNVQVLSVASTSIADGFYRVDLVLRTTGATNNAYNLYLLDGDFNTSYTGLNDGSGCSVHNLTFAWVTGFAATSLTTGDAALGTPALAQKQVLSASSLVGGAAVLGTVALVQKQVLTATGLTGAAASLGTPALVQSQVLTATALTGAAAAIGQPALVQKHVLTGTSLTAGAAVFGTPALTEAQALTASPLTGGAAALGTPALSQEHALTATTLAAGAAILGQPSISQGHVLAATALVGGAAELGTPVLSEAQALTATALEGGAAVLGTPALGQVHALSGTSLAAGAAVLGEPAVAQGHVLAATPLVGGAAVLGTPTLSTEGTDNLSAVSLTGEAAQLGTPALSQGHVLAATSLIGGAAILGTPVLATSGVTDLTATSIVVGNAVLGTPALSQGHVLTAVDIVTGAPVFGTPLLNPPAEGVVPEVIEEEVPGEKGGRKRKPTRFPKYDDSIARYFEERRINEERDERDLAAIMAFQREQVRSVLERILEGLE